MRGATGGGGQGFAAPSFPAGSSASGAGTPSRRHAYVSPAPASASVARTEDSGAAPTSDETVAGVDEGSRASAGPRSSSPAASATTGSHTRCGTAVGGE